MTPGKKKRKDEEIGTGDRFVTAVLGALLAFLTGSVIWLIVVSRSARVEREGPIVPFWVVLVFAAFMGLVGFLIGPKRMMDMFERIWRRRDWSNSPLRTRLQTPTPSASRLAGNGDPTHRDQVPQDAQHRLISATENVGTVIESES
jgi:hypothetical protein